VKRFTTKIKWRGKGNVVIIEQANTKSQVLEMTLEDWLKLPAVQYAVELAKEREVSASDARTNPGD
jgi:hypothetical protein